MRSSNSNSSREDSPDWLRSFQAPTQLAQKLSSGSISLVISDDEEDEISLTKLFNKETSPNKEEHTPVRKRKRKGEMDMDPTEEEEKSEQGPPTKQIPEEKPFVSSGHHHSVWALSSDSDDSLHETRPPVSTANIHDASESLLNEVSTVKAPKKKLKKEIDKLENTEEMKENAGDMDLEEKTADKCSGLYVSSSRLPLVLSEKVQRTKALVECEGDSIDLSGDVGAVGRVVISEGSSGNPEMLLDLKGTVYRTSIIPSRTFCVVSFGQSEAKIEAVVNDFIQLKSEANVFGAETMVEGTLDGFSFDSEDEFDNMPKPNPPNQGEDEGGDEQKPKGKTKKAAKASSAGQKKAKATTGGKKVKKKSQAPKKSKAKK